MLIIFKSMSAQITTVIEFLFYFILFFYFFLFYFKL